MFKVNSVDDLILCCEMNKRIIKNRLSRTGGPVSLGDCINCSTVKKGPTKRQAVPPLREKLSDILPRYPGPLRGKPPILPMRAEITKGVSVKPDEIIFDEWNSIKETVYTPKQRPLTFRTELMRRFLGNED